MRIGAHVSAAGGVQNAPANAAALGCETFQFFTRSPQGGKAPKITSEIREAFLEAARTNNFESWVVHAPYYINFASERELIRAASTRIIREELERASQLEAKFMMFHPGSAREVGLEQAMLYCIFGIENALKGYTGSTVPLIEISAGAGEVIGDTFEELDELLKGIEDSRLGICLDTAHMFASGYDMRKPEVLNKTLDELDEKLGLKKVRMIHCNDSKIGLGGKRDMHEHIGKGKIGSLGFKSLVTNPRLKQLDLYCETKPDGVKKDVALLKKMRDKG
ncbi:MAG: deoxyribonuclease IV [Alphaproteobacteria bacterium]|nr:deoxyribonuclease IV [Alphaproteobacteria bacterium]